MYVATVAQVEVEEYAYMRVHVFLHVTNMYM